MFRDYHLENPVGTFATRSLQLSTFRHSISDQGMTDRAVFMGRAGRHVSVFPHQSHQEMPRVHRNLDNSGSYFQLSLLLADGRVQFPPLPASARPMLRGRYLPVYWLTDERVGTQAFSSLSPEASPTWPHWLKYFQSHGSNVFQLFPEISWKTKTKLGTSDTTGLFSRASTSVDSIYF